MYLVPCLCVYISDVLCHYDVKDSLAMKPYCKLVDILERLCENISPIAPSAFVIFCSQTDVSQTNIDDIIMMSHVHVRAST